MEFELEFTDEAELELKELEEEKSKNAELKAVRKVLGYMETNLRHPSLQTHPYHSLKGPNGEKVFETYAQNKTPGAYRIFWYYGRRGIIKIASIVSHP